MPNSTGTSVVGRQFMGGFSNVLDNWLLVPIGTNKPDIDERIGTVIISLFVATGVEPAQSVFKLYGGGVFWPNYPFTGVENMRLYTVWFRAGIEWQFNRS